MKRGRNPTQQHPPTQQALPPPALDLRDARDFEEHYRREANLGEGTFGDVFLAVEREGGYLVAVKRLREPEGKHYDRTARREVTTLRRLDHINVVRLHEVVVNRFKLARKTDVYLIMEYAQHDLRGLMRSKRAQWWSQKQVVGIAAQVMRALAYCHSQNVMHRDVKPENVLVARDGTVKLADFGLCAPYNPEWRQYTNPTVTLWYRSPELLLGARAYGPKVDAWAAGCLLGELLGGGATLLPGRDDVDQLARIWDLCGTPNSNGWRAAAGLPQWAERRPRDGEKKRALKTLLGARNNKMRHRKSFFTDDAVSAVDVLLTLNPTKRMGVAEVLKQPYFASVPPYPLPLLWRIPDYGAESYYASGKGNARNLVAEAEERRDKKRNKRAPPLKRGP